jgi:deoxyribonuclease V
VNYSELHSWDLDYASARDLQVELSRHLKLIPLKSTPNIIAGCDVSCDKLNPILRAGVVIMKFPEFTILETAVAEVETYFPYIPGLLSFREMPALLSAWRKIEIIPDLVFCDGSGTIHPRKFGLACHLGLWLNIPTVGCAKNLLCGEYENLETGRGNVSEVVYQNEVLGTALRSKTGVKPLFISPGNLITLKQAVEYTLQCAPHFRLPEPIRSAHTLAQSKNKK